MKTIQRLSVLCLTVLLGGCSLDPSAPVTFRPEDRPSLAALDAPPPYAGRARVRERKLARALNPIVVVAMTEAAAIKRQVAEAVVVLPVPQRFATREPELRRFHETQKGAYFEAVRGLYDGALAQLDALLSTSMSQGEALAQTLAADRSPLDEGASGDPLLDRQLRSFKDTLRMTLGRGGLEAAGYQAAGHRVDKLEVFSSFTAEGADDALGGRLMLFVGTDSATDLPLCDVVLRVEPGVAPADRGLFQAVRFRVMAGTTIIEDLGWTALPAGTGLPGVEVWHERYLIAPDIAPKVVKSAAGYEQLRSLRVVADVQTVVFDRAHTVLGGVDWRLEYRVSDRGELTWQPSPIEPAFNGECAEAKGLLAGLGVN
ncbi:MAG: hypothetical protein ACI9EF_002287 [Pseudohongiellaceae bacterium]|jgi:hypothetical protein